MVKPLSDCTFYVTSGPDGLFVGRCREWPDITSRPRRRRLDAIDDVFDKVREKLRHVDAQKGGAQHG